MAALEPKAAETIMNEHPEIKSWYLAGHSMGGLTASGFAADYPDKVDGLIFLAAYTKLDSSSLRSNWIEQPTNAAAQASVFTGILILFLKG